MRSLLPIWTAMLLMAIFLLSACTGFDGIRSESEQDKIVKTNVDLGLGYLKRGQYDIALQKIQRALDMDWENGDAHTVAALVYERMKKIDKADEHYQYAIEYKPRDGAVLNNYGVFLCRQSRWKDAVNKFIAAVKQPGYKTPARAYENAGACARRIPDEENAEKYLRKALSQNPELPVALYEMAELSFEKKKPLSVRAYLQRYEAVAAHTPQSLWLGVRAEKQLGDDDAAARYAKLLQRKFPESEEFQKLLELDDSRTGS